VEELLNKRLHGKMRKQSAIEREKLARFDCDCVYIYVGCYIIKNSNKNKNMQQK